MKCAICDTDAHRHACDPCLADTRRRLRELELYATWLQLAAMLQPGRGTTGRRSPGYTSRAPAKLDALVLVDSRSSTDPTPIDEDRGLGLDDDDEPGWPIVDTLHRCATFVRDHAGHPQPRTVTLAGEIGYLLSRLDWAANQSWITDLAGWIREQHAQARRAVHDAPNPLGKCWNDCGGQVYPATLRAPKTGLPVDGARCNRCDRPYTGLDLAKLAIQRDREAS